MPMDDEDRGEHGADDDRGRRIAGGCRNGQRKGARDRPRGNEARHNYRSDEHHRGNRSGIRRKYREHAGRGGHALTAAEVEPRGIDVTDDGRETCGHDHHQVSGHEARDENSQCTLQAIEKHDRHGGHDAGGAQDVCGADVAAACGAKIDPERSRQQERERNRAEEVPEGHGDDDVHRIRSRGVYVGPFGDSLL